MKDHLTIVNHPLVQHKLTLMREKETSTAVFRQLLKEIAMLLAYEVTGDLEMTTKKIETPLRETSCPTLKGKKLALISILRAGNGLLEMKRRYSQCNPILRCQPNYRTSAS